MAGARGCSAAWTTQVARLTVAGASVGRRCDAWGAVKTAKRAGARGCSAAWATQVARLAVAGAGVCRRCDAVGAVKTAEVAGARDCSAAEYCMGAELQGRGPRHPIVGRDPSVQGDDQLRLSLRQGSRQPFAEI